MHRILALVVLVLSASGPLLGQGITWETDLEAAKERAAEENKPLLIALHNTTEVACRRMLTKVYRDPAVQKALAEFVILPTCFDRHEEVKSDGQTSSKYFPGISCEALVKNEKVVREELLESANVKVPQHVFVGADGAIYLTKIYELKKTAFLDLLRRGLVMYGSEGVAKLEAELQGHFDEVRTGKEKRVRAAVKAILELQDLRKAELLYYTIQGMKKSEDRGMAIRAFGYDEYTFAAPVVIRWLEDSDAFVRNCAVVSLEEMKAADAGPRLITMWQEEKRKEKDLRKDILRAMGPCCGDDEAAREVLMAATGEKDGPKRAAAYMSLGPHLQEESVRELLAKRWRKEGKDLMQKSAILHAYGMQRDAELVPDVEKLLAKERNGQLELIGKVAIAKLRGETTEGIVTGRQYRKLVAPLYAHDKIQRNRRRFWRERR